MNVPIDAHQPEWRMVEMFLEYTQDEIAQANLRRLSRISHELIGSHLEKEPVRSKLGHLRMGYLQGGGFGGAVGEQFMQNEPSRGENRRIETAA